MNGMSREWVIEVNAEPSDPREIVFHLGVRETVTGKMILVTPTCRSMEDLSREVKAMKAELDKVLEEAQGKLEADRSQGAGADELVPDKVWKEMELTASKEEMFDYFNSYGEAERQRIAEYIFSHANMFKGRGPVFSEHYDHSSHMLE